MGHSALWIFFPLLSRVRFHIEHYSFPLLVASYSFYSTLTYLTYQCWLEKDWSPLSSPDRWVFSNFMVNCSLGRAATSSHKHVDSRELETDLFLTARALVWAISAPSQCCVADTMLYLGLFSRSEKIDLDAPPNLPGATVDVFLGDLVPEGAGTCRTFSPVEHRRSGPITGRLLAQLGETRLVLHWYPFYSSRCIRVGAL